MATMEEDKARLAAEAEEEINIKPKPAAKPKKAVPKKTAAKKK